ncbi:MAG: tyrosine-type recombinase/integrase [Saprospiraceae bacterium]|nr:tyrosine-type recombinase/integrase [Saprospiraceae bacterium]
MLSKVRALFNYLGQRPVTRNNIDKFFDFLLEEKRLRPATYNNYLGILDRLLRPLGYTGTKHIAKIKRDCVPARYFTRSQANFIISRLEEENPPLWFFVQFVYYCFLRPRTELRLLKVGNIILEDQKILVPYNIAKNKKTQYVIIPDAFIDLVEKKVKGRNPNEYLFLSTKFPNQPTGVNTFAAQHRKLLKKYGFETRFYKLYSWKHTGAVVAAKNNIHIKQLQIQLRHHSLDQVNDYLRQMGVTDMDDFSSKMPSIG